MAPLTPRKHLEKTKLMAAKESQIDHLEPVWLGYGFKIYQNVNN
jgi:hypothetical protein